MPESRLTRGAGRDAIPAITDLVFGDDWNGISVSAADSLGEREVESRLLEDDRVVGVARDYTRNPYASYESSGRVGLGEPFDDDRFHPKPEVLGVATEATARAYPAETVDREVVINDTLGRVPVAVTTTADGRPLAYVRRVGGETVRFRAAGDRFLTAAETRWRRSDGLAVDGLHEGARLTQTNDVSALFWFAWLDFHLGSEVYGRQGS